MIRQIFIVSKISFGTLRHRFWQSTVIVVGLAATIGVLLSMNSLSEGRLQGYLKAGDPGRAIVLSKDANSEASSAITRDLASLVIVAPGIAKDNDGSPIVDLGINANLPVERNNGSIGNMTVRGVGPKALKVRPELKIVAGRMFQSGRHEVVVGAAAQANFRGMHVGDTVAMPDGNWKIVGAFKSGDILEGQLLADAEMIMAATHKKNFNSILVRLSSPASFSVFKNAIISNPALPVTVERHSDWFRRNSVASFSNFMTAIAYTIGSIMGVGALFGCLNTMYAAVSVRELEIATLRALGFSAFSVAVSVILEATLLSVGGALVGGTIARLLFDGKEQVFGTNVYTLAVTWDEIAFGIFWACGVAFLGGLLPAVRVARRSVADALRAT